MALSKSHKCMNAHNCCNNELHCRHVDYPPQTTIVLDDDGYIRMDGKGNLYICRNAEPCTPLSVPQTYAQYINSKSNAKLTDNDWWKRFTKFDFNKYFKGAVDKINMSSDLIWYQPQVSTEYKQHLNLNFEFYNLTICHSQRSFVVKRMIRLIRKMLMHIGENTQGRDTYLLLNSDGSFTISADQTVIRHTMHAIRINDANHISNNVLTWFICQLFNVNNCLRFTLHIDLAKDNYIPRAVSFSNCNPLQKWGDVNPMFLHNFVAQFNN